jgi:hypothetical protein
MTTTDPNEEVITTLLNVCVGGGFEYRPSPLDGMNDELISIVSCIIGKWLSFCSSAGLQEPGSPRSEGSTHACNMNHNIYVLHCIFEAYFNKIQPSLEIWTSVYHGLALIITIDRVTPRTVIPRLRSESTTWVPIKPVAPVTRT